MAVLRIPALSLVALVGASGSGKSTFARRHFRATEVLSSDFFRGLVRDDETAQDASRDAFDALYFVAEKRLAAGRLTVVDATNVNPEARKPLVAMARRHHALPVAIVLDVPERVAQERNEARPDRQFGPHVVRNHVAALRRSLRSLASEGFRTVHVLRGVEEIDAATIERAPMWCDRREDRGPFDLIGDVHGCFEELRELLAKLGYSVTEETAADGGARYRVVPPAGRRALFLGDLVDRGPASPAVLRLVMDMVEDGAALCVPGNHDEKLLRKLRGKNVKITHGLERTLEQMEREPPAFAERARAFLDDLVSHYVLDGGDLVVAHAGMKESMQGRGSGAVRSFALYGETTGETDEYGLPVRYPWAADYRGRAHVVYGHTPVPEPQWLNRTICIDTGCCFGGALTALRWPEKELVSVPARQEWYPPVRPLRAAPVDARSAQHAADDLLDLAEITGRRAIETRLQANVTIREENAIPAVEAMSRFAIDPKWLVHLPPTMSPVATSARDGLLEHPAEAFADYREAGVAQVVCEEKHMGSRMLAAVCRDADAARRRFGVEDGASGRCWTRTGRAFFPDEAEESAVVDRLRAALSAAGTWDALATDWVVLDAELMPWSAKAQALVESQYAAVGAAARAAFPASVSALEHAAARGLPVGEILDRTRARDASARRYVDAYRRYCAPVASVDDLRVAPFHVLASEGRVHADRDHLWHLATLAPLAAHDRLFVATRHRVVDLGDAASEAAATAWWEELTAAGGEGMVVKPLGFTVAMPARPRDGDPAQPSVEGARPSRPRLVQPALKVRGPEYLRIIYGPDYDTPEHVARLRQRHLGAKRSLALREFALGIEALERFVRREPLRRVHECVFGVLALETEPVDPRL